MKFDDLDKKMRVFETAADLCVLPSMFMVARLDGRSFTRLTKEVGQFEVPFDVRFRDLMVATTESLMTCGFRVLFAYTESDEISLLFDLEEQLFGRKLRKYNSTLAGEASARFSLKLGQPACFDCRISQLPTAESITTGRAGSLRKAPKRGHVGDVNLTQTNRVLRHARVALDSGYTP